MSYVRVRRRVASASALTVLLAVAFSSCVLSSGAGAQESSAFRGLAVADGPRVTFGVREYLIIEQFVDAGTPTAQASVDTLTSTAFASAAYPGANVLALSNRGTPPYPLIAMSNLENPEAKVEHGPVSLTAKSTVSTSESRAVTAASQGNGSSVGSSTSLSSVTHDPRTGDVTATAESSTAPSTFAGVLTVGQVDARATVVAPGSGGPPEKSSSFAAKGISVAGQSVELTAAGLVLPGTTVPLPATDPVMQVLDGAGLSVRYVAPSEDDDGTQSAALVVEQAVPLPGAPKPGVLTVLYGGASAHATGGGADAPADSAGTDEVPITTDAGTGGSDLATEAPAQGSVSTTFDAGTLAPVVTAGDDPSAESPTVAPDGAAAEVRALPLNRGSPVLSASSFYLMLVLSSVLILGSAQLLRFFAVRVGWNS